MSLIEGRGVSTVLSIGYVGSVYIMPGGRSQSSAISVVWRRLLGVLAFSAIVSYNMGFGLREWAAIDMPAIKNSVKAVVLVQALYLGTLFSYGLPPIERRNWTERLNTIKTLIVGPLTEEFIYRGVVVALYRESGRSDTTILRENFWYFGIAHMHHGVMSWLNGDGTGKQICVRSLVHFMITSLFGTFACYLFLRTDSIWPSVFAHALCNYYGPPRISGSPVYLALSAISVGVFAFGLQYF